MSALKNKYKFVTLLLIAALLILVACGGDEETPTVAPTNTPEPAATATTAPDPTATTAADPTATVAVTDTQTITTSDTVTAARSGPVSPLDQPASPLGQPESPLSQSAPPPPLPTSEPGTATVTGRLLSNTNNQPLNHAVVRLAEVTCPGEVKQEEKRTKCVWALDNTFSPTAFTDENGYFIFNNIEGKDYIVLIGDMVLKYTIIRDDENQPMIWNAPLDEVVDIGEFTIDY